MRRTDLAYWALAIGTAASIATLLAFVFLRVPVAQPEAGGLAQKIFYFHVPAAYAMYLSGVVCGVASGAYLARPTTGRDALAHAAAETAVVFGAMVLVSGPLWARKAWGVYWTWDPRLTTLLLSVLVYGTVVLLRSFAAGGDAERRFAAAIGVLGTVNLPIIHYSVRKWGGNHPTVIGKGGGGLRHPDMTLALSLGFVALTLLAVLLLWSRARLRAAEHRVASLEERLLTAEGLS
ncbi:MAG: cytochrome c biogenesis protein CcsA [Polyangiaceae bacterium]|nr:cytochrome c biogenesis protein CcsA [Polyangiaceae bacterium]